MVSVGTQTESDDESPFDFTDEPGDVSWIPQEEMRSDLSDEEPLQESLLDLHVADKFIVCRSQLMSLFTICPACCEETQGKVEKQEGTFVKIKQVRGCLCSMWVSAFLEEPANAAWKYAACNLLLSGAIHFSGCMAAQTIRMLQRFGLQSISVGSFFDISAWTQFLPLCRMSQQGSLEI
ncbi:hypothetical protein QQF64_020077 [Cirrhinus molitorella]|uniref:Uncharacterized protein n=1 Tax=Cirrhinus molitorella TaxID=172907 RepID=A0ABR3LJT5_9TELE